MAEKPFRALHSISGGATVSSSQSHELFKSHVSCWIKRFKRGRSFSGTFELKSKTPQ